MARDPKEILAPDFTWVPPDIRRTEIRIHPDAARELRRLLHEPEYAEIGYSEFIMRAVVEARGRLKVPGIV